MNVERIKRSTGKCRIRLRQFGVRGGGLVCPGVGGLLLTITSEAAASPEIIDYGAGQGPPH